MKPVTFACIFLNNGPICNLLAPLESSQSPLFKSWPSCPYSGCKAPKSQGLAPLAAFSCNSLHNHQCYEGTCV